MRCEKRGDIIEQNNIYEGLEDIWNNYEEFKNKFEERITLLTLLLKNEYSKLENKRIYDGLEDVWREYEDFKNKFETIIASMAI